MPAAQQQHTESNTCLFQEKNAHKYIAHEWMSCPVLFLPLLFDWWNTDKFALIHNLHDGARRIVTIYSAIYKTAIKNNVQ